MSILLYSLQKSETNQSTLISGKELSGQTMNLLQKIKPKDCLLLALIPVLIWFVFLLLEMIWRIGNENNWSWYSVMFTKSLFTLAPISLLIGGLIGIMQGIKGGEYVSKD